ncbi:MAG: dTMP kinase [Acidimicrobiia bacterium]|nr:MAG: dTMP kinase [Acidimicrobiia bacterium]
MIRYLAIEGIDGAGKSTVARMVADALEERGHAVTLVREPGGTPAGERIRDILLGSDSSLDDWTEALLFAAARAQLAADVVSPALQRGDLVVSDRSYHSSIAYQGAARGLGVEAVERVNRYALRGVVPDMVALLRLDPERGLDREVAADRISSEGLDFQRRVAESYDRIAEAEPDRFLVVDASAPLHEVVERIVEAVEAP